MQTETFGAGSDDQNLARAQGFQRMVEAAGQEWPDGWVKGEGFVRPHADADPMKPPPTVAEIGEEYVRQLVDLSPGQRKRYLAQVRTVCAVEVKAASGARLYRPFEGTVAQVKEADIKAWLIGWDRSLKTTANYHGPAVRRVRLRRRTGLPGRQPARAPPPSAAGSGSPRRACGSSPRPSSRPRRARRSRR